MKLTLLKIIIVLQSIVITILSFVMTEYTFNSESTRIAYEAGCKIGQHYIDSSKFSCYESSKNFKDAIEAE